MKVHSGHIYLHEKYEWKDLEKIFPEFLNLFIEESRQSFDDPEIMQVLIYENLKDLKQNRKPEGYVRDGKMKLVFTRDKQIEIKLLRDKVVPNEDTKNVTEKLSMFLKSKKIRHHVDYDKMFWIELKKRKK